MSEVLDQLVQLLSLERQSDDVFVGECQDLGWGRVFGGQVLGQSLSAAEQTVPEGRSVHSFHSYFLLPGAVDKPIEFTVDRIRDGRSFNTRRVVATQNGQAIFSLSASFQVREDGFEHQTEAMPEVPAPEQLVPDLEMVRRYLEKLPDSLKSKIPKHFRERVVAERPIELRVLNPIDPLNPKKGPAETKLWARAKGALPDASSVHQYMLAYASDFYLLASSMRPHGVHWMTPGMQVASLDHSMYFLRPFRFDEWLLYDIEAPAAIGARGLARGRWFNQKGELVACTVQEGLIRDRRR